HSQLRPQGAVECRGHLRIVLIPWHWPLLLVRSGLPLSVTRNDGSKVMIFGAHVIVYSRDAAADRVFYRDVLGFTSVDAGHDWLVFALPRAELAVHPADEDASAALYLMCDDLRATMEMLERKGVRCTEPEQARWGSVTR